MSVIEDDSSQSSLSESEELEVLTFGILETKIIKAVVEECIEQINILVANYAPPSISFNDAKERYKTPIRITEYGEEEPNDKEQISEKMEIDKSLLMKLLCGMRDELRTRSGIGLTARFLKLWSVREAADEEQIQEYWTRRSKLHHMKKMISDTRRHKKRINKEKILMAEALQERLEEASRRAGTEFQYCKKWESVRKEQNRLVCKREERTLRKQLASTSEKTDDEIRVHQATVSYLTFALKRLEEKIKVWTERYNKDVEERDIDMANLKQKRSEVADQLHELYHLYQEREAEMEAFKEILRERERKEQERLMKEIMAVKIQAWWRGVMVRAKLGPFKALFKKDKKKKKGKK